VFAAERGVLESPFGDEDERPSGVISDAIEMRQRRVCIEIACAGKRAARRLSAN
jgi:hypothetical protein